MLRSRKFRAPPNPMRVERGLPTIKATEEERKRNLDNYIQQKLANAQEAGNPDGIQAWSFIKAQTEMKAHEGQVDADFLTGFHNFLLGKETVAEHRRVRWGQDGRGRPIPGDNVRQVLTQIPGVRAYLMDFVNERFEFERYIKRMKAMGPIAPHSLAMNLKTAHFYYKYVVRAEPVTDDTFLADYRLFKDLQDPDDFAPFTTESRGERAQRFLSGHFKQDPRAEGGYRQHADMRRGTTDIRPVHGPEDEDAHPGAAAANAEDDEGPPDAGEPGLDDAGPGDDDDQDTEEEGIPPDEQAEQLTESTTDFTESTIQSDEMLTASTDRTQETATEGRSASTDGAQSAENLEQRAQRQVAEVREAERRQPGNGEGVGEEQTVPTPTPDSAPTTQSDDVSQVDDATRPGTIGGSDAPSLATDATADDSTTGDPLTEQQKLELDRRGGTQAAAEAERSGRDVSKIAREREQAQQERDQALDRAAKAEEEAKEAREAAETALRGGEQAVADRRLAEEALEQLMARRQTDDMRSLRSADSAEIRRRVDERLAQIVPNEVSRRVTNALDTLDPRATEEQVAALGEQVRQILLAAGLPVDDLPGPEQRGELTEDQRKVLELPEVLQDLMAMARLSRIARTAQRGANVDREVIRELRESNNFLTGALQAAREEPTPDALAATEQGRALQDAQARNTALERDMEQLRTRLADAERRPDEEATQREQLEATNRDLVAQVARLRESLTRSLETQPTTDGREAELARLREEERTARDAAAAQGQEIIAMRTDRDRAQAEQVRAENERDRLQRELDQTRNAQVNTTGTLNDRIADLERDLGAAREETRREQERRQDIEREKDVQINAAAETARGEEQVGAAGTERTLRQQITDLRTAAGQADLAAKEALEGKEGQRRKLSVRVKELEQAIRLQQHQGRVTNAAANAIEARHNRDVAAIREQQDQTARVTADLNNMRVELALQKSAALEQKNRADDLERRERELQGRADEANAALRTAIRAELEAVINSFRDGRPNLARQQLEGAQERLTAPNNARLFTTTPRGRRLTAPDDDDDDPATEAVRNAERLIADVQRDLDKGKDPAPPQQQRLPSSGSEDSAATVAVSLPRQPPAATAGESSAAAEARRPAAEDPGNKRARTGPSPGRRAPGQKRPTTPRPPPPASRGGPPQPPVAPTDHTQVTRVNVTQVSTATLNEWLKLSDDDTIRNIMRTELRRRR